MVARTTACETCVATEITVTNSHERPSKITRKDEIRRLRELNNNEVIGEDNAPDCSKDSDVEKCMRTEKQRRKNNKFISASELNCFSYSPRDSQIFEHDIPLKAEEGCFVSDELDKYDCLFADVEITRKARKNKVTKARVQLKGAYYIKLNKNCGKKLYVKSYNAKKMEKRAETFQDAICARKENIDKNLVKRKLKREGPKYPEFISSPPVRNTSTKNTHRHKNSLKIHKYELTDDRIAPSESYLAALISLQHRELTPEDYEVLLRLDEAVAPKTVQKTTLDSFKVDTVTSPISDSLCAICMEGYEIGDHRKYLPCDHVFHSKCIDMWLTNSGMSCPLDGLDVS